MKHFRTLIFAIVMLLSMQASAQTDTTRHEVLLETSKGNITIALYNETPRHRDNFLRLVRNHDLDSMLWHRVIPNFMIQSGDPASKHAPKGQLLGEQSIGGDTMRAEIVFPKLFHKRGAVASAREPDDVNPNRNSSGSQFYIVYGRRFDDDAIEQIQMRLNRETNCTVRLTDEQRRIYYQQGGAPHLDGQYTVFGEVVSGMDVVKAIDFVPTDENNRPLDDVRIIRATVVK